MPKDFSRSERLASQIHREIAGLIRQGVKDPRLSIPSILDVEVSRDITQAKVYFSVLDPETAEDCQLALSSASGYLQHEIGRVLKSRITPRLKFIYDDTDLKAQSLSKLIDDVIARDELKQQE
jgi:ribosome-binding factor A